MLPSIQCFCFPQFPRAKVFPVLHTSNTEETYAEHQDIHSVLVQTKASTSCADTGGRYKCQSFPFNTNQISKREATLILSVGEEMVRVGQGYQECPENCPGTCKTAEFCLSVCELEQWWQHNVNRKSTAPGSLRRKERTVSFCIKEKGGGPKKFILGFLFLKWDGQQVS